VPDRECSGPLGDKYSGGTVADRPKSNALSAGSLGLKPISNISVELSVCLDAMCF